MLFRKAVSALSVPVRRNIMTTPVKRSSDPLIGHVNQEAMPGLNIPISTQNRYKLAAMLMFYFGSAFSAPFIIVRYQLLKKSA